MSQPLNGYRQAVVNFKREYLRRMLAQHGGNRTRTARALGIQRTYLLRLLRQFELNDRGLRLARSGKEVLNDHHPHV